MPHTGTLSDLLFLLPRSSQPAIFSNISLFSCESTSPAHFEFSYREKKSSFESEAGFFVLGKHCRTSEIKSDRKIMIWVRQEKRNLKLIVKLFAVKTSKQSVRETTKATAWNYECNQFCGVDSLVNFQYGSVNWSHNFRRWNFSAFSQVSLGPSIVLCEIHSKINDRHNSMKERKNQRTQH